MMRHDDIEHRRLRPEPFTVDGDLAFVLRTFGLPEDMDATKAEDLFCGDDVRTCSITGKPCVITTWQCVRADDGPTFYTVEAQPVQVVSKPATPVDPWVKVGTTTIDGTIMQVATLLDASGWGPPLTESEAENAIDLFMKQDERYHDPWIIGGRHLRARSSHVNASRGTALIRCDVVRRQSEIDAEQRTVPCINCEVPTATLSGFCDECMDRFRDDEPPCPECGPHGNRGEVLLASSWAKCTTCAGGKPGDLWGEVRPSEEPRFWSSVANKMVTVAEALALGRSLRRPEDEAEAEPESVKALSRPPSFDLVGHKPGSIGMLATYVEGERVVDRWGRHGVVLGMSGKLVRVQMDEGWTGLHAMCELVGKASE